MHVKYKIEVIIKKANRALSNDIYKFPENKWDFCNDFLQKEIFICF